MGIPKHVTCLPVCRSKAKLEPDMEQQTGWKLGKEYIKALYCHLVYLTYMQSTSRKMPGWMKHKVKVKSLSHVRLFATHGLKVHGIFRARILEWVAISFSRGSSRPRDRTLVSRIPGRGFNLWATFYKTFGFWKIRTCTKCTKEYNKPQVLITQL